MYMNLFSRVKTFQYIRLGVLYMVLIGAAGSIDVNSAFAATSTSTDCTLVSSCQSDTSITGANAGATICNNVGLDYMPACNTTSCLNASTGNYGYACTAPASATNGAGTPPPPPSGTPPPPPSSSASGTGIVIPSNTGLPEGAIVDILSNFFQWLLMIFSILAIGAFIISGIQYLIAAGDKDMVESAKRNMKWSVVGVLVGFSGYIILQAVDGALSSSPIF